MIDEKLFYPLLKDFDVEFFKKLKIAVKNNYQFIGLDKEKEFFVKCLLCLQMLKDYRSPLVAIYENLSKKTDLKIINAEIRSKNFEFDYSWAVWSRDKYMGKRAEKIFNSPLKLIGSDKDFDEFVLRYLISIWLVSWEGPLYILLELAKFGEIDLHEMNEYLRMFDFTGIFSKASVPTNI